MKANKAEQQGLITLLNRIYSEIRDVEQDWDIRVDEKDYRPRIEYFHDAIRALTSGMDAERTGRLSVEFLAYDITMLRHIQANPLARSKGAKPTGSPSTSLMVRPSAINSKGKPDESIKQRLTDGYKSYAVLFAALLSDSADRNYQNRLNECNNAFENLAMLEQMLKSSAQKKDTEINLEDFVEQQTGDDDLAEKIRATIASKRKRVMASETVRACKEMMNTADKQIKTIEKAHFTYTMSQLAVYEGARDVVKKMAQQGMNIVGDFVENAVREARGGKGR